MSWREASRGERGGGGRGGGLEGSSPLSRKIPADAIVDDPPRYATPRPHSPAMPRHHGSLRIFPHPHHSLQPFPSPSLGPPNTEILPPPRFSVIPSPLTSQIYEKETKAEIRATPPQIPDVGAERKTPYTPPYSRRDSYGG